MRGGGIGRFEMKQVDKISASELAEFSKKMFDPLVKAVVDVRKKILVIDADMHVDEELYLLDNGSNQADLWGINLWPDKYGSEDFIEFDSMINLRPYQNNRSRGVDDAEIRRQIRDIVGGVVYGG
jgi:hypothetical protein